ncbi:MAG: DUF1275 domain-containing protein [Paraburkholderia sp.]|nr:DUF1275 domain-containing protein [Paraburkholderia sp.]
MSAPTETLPVLLRRITALSMVAGYVEVVGFLDLKGIYPGIMTGNTVQLGLSFAKSHWDRFASIGTAVGLFFIGCIIASAIRWHLRRPPLELALMAVLLLVAGIVRRAGPTYAIFELPLLALAMAMQGETIARFGGVAVQTIVVTNNMVKFCDGLVGRCLVPFDKRLAPQSKMPELKEMLLPGLAWLTYSIGAAAGALAAPLRMVFAAPAVMLILTVIDLVARRPETATA